MHGKTDTDQLSPRKPGDAPALNNAEITDIVAFLTTLTDGYDPATNGVKAVN